jgi:hypothetical protein
MLPFVGYMQCTESIEKVIYSSNIRFRRKGNFFMVALFVVKEGEQHEVILKKFFILKVLEVLSRLRVL